MARLCQALVVVLVVVAGAGSAAADDETAARAAYQEGTRYYDLGRYREALAAFERAYVQFESPALLFNIGQCHRQLGNRVEAVRFYRKYLEFSPTPADAPAVRQQIADLEAAPPTVTPPVPLPVTPPPTPPVVVAPTPPSVAVVTPAEPSTGRRFWWLWAGIGVAAVGGGVTLGVLIVSSSPRDPQTTDGIFPVMPR